MATLHGKNLIAGDLSGSSAETFHARNPATGEQLEPAFHEAAGPEIGRALQAAAGAFPTFSRTTQAARAAFLESIADEIFALGDALLERAHRETGLPLERLTGERGRTMGQLRLFAGLLREGSWCDARIDTALPDRQPLPRPDLRRMLVPLGPVVVFGASNFPLAFSVAGGDTASALAAGCPVVVKGHPAHPGTSELVAAAIVSAAGANGMDAGVFSLVHGCGAKVGLELVGHPAACAVGFTGSQHAGRALFDAASRRPSPIPVFAEMSSVNPLVVMPRAMDERGPEIAAGLRNSVTMGVGQFCTKPGLVFVAEGPGLDGFISALEREFLNTQAGTMLHEGIAANYGAGVARLSSQGAVRVLASSVQPDTAGPCQARVAVFVVDADGYRSNPEFQQELFGPQALVVVARDLEEIADLCAGLEGQLTATIHAAPDDLAHADHLFAVLQEKAGRLVFNGFPTGVEVSPAMQHGGPYPATTDSRFTSVGTAAIQRWARPVCYQSFPSSALPVALLDHNPLGLMRLVNGQPTRAGV